MDETDQLAAFPLYLKDGAIDWYDTLGQDVRNNMEQLLKEFQSFFCPSPIDHVLQAESVFTRVQRPNERVRDYVSAVQKLARRLPALDEGILKCIILRGLRPNIKAFVLQQRADTIAEILEATRVAESAGIATMGADNGKLTLLFFTLINIPPKLKSSCRAFSLLLLLKHRTAESLVWSC